MDENPPKERRRRPRLPARASMQVQLWLQLPNGKWQKLSAAVENFSQSGLGVLVHAELETGQTVLVEGAPASVASGPGRPHGIVSWVNPAGNAFRAGISFELSSPGGPSIGNPYAVNSSDEELDYYEFLQIHPKAEPDTIHRVYGILAKRFHPENQDTGSEQLFKALVTAYRVLGDPVRRAAYDVERGRAQKRQWRVFSPESASGGVEAEREQRQAVLAMLYVKRMRETHNPGVHIQEFEEILGIPREHLEFTLWYLRKQGFVVRTHHGRYAITVKGVDRAEEWGATPRPAASYLTPELCFR
ncbi:MAG: DnaJ domain-containing protein [Acidobacteria bacterium]|jgi:hypothetical protein|nr:DnaJ domain-containing protein [Acidobacteriota bacterium]